MPVFPLLSGEEILYFHKNLKWMIYSVRSSTVTAIRKGFPKAGWGGVSSMYHLMTINWKPTMSKVLILRSRKLGEILKY